MRRKRNLPILAMALCLWAALAACGGKTAREEASAPVAGTDTVSEEETVSGETGLAQEESGTEGENTKSSSAYGKVEKKVVMRAVVKELDGEKMLISSRSDAFPGAFYAQLPETGMDLSDISAGDTVLICMKDLEKTEEKLPCYEVVSVMGNPEKQEGREDVLLTGAPEISLQDALSSTLAEYVMLSGNYSWNYMQDGEMLSLVACGEAPFETAKGARDKLKIPHYNGLEEVAYLVGCQVMPDRFTLQEWQVPMEDTAKQPVSETVYYEPPFMIALKKDRAYIITAVWEKQEETEGGFYGEAEYVLVTE